MDFYDFPEGQILPDGNNTKSAALGRQLSRSTSQFPLYSSGTPLHGIVPVES